MLLGHNGCHMCKPGVPVAVKIEMPTMSLILGIHLDMKNMQSRFAVD